MLYLEAPHLCGVCSCRVERISAIYPTFSELNDWTRKLRRLGGGLAFHLHSRIGQDMCIYTAYLRLLAFCFELLCCLLCFFSASFKDLRVHGYLVLCCSVVDAYFTIQRSDRCFISRASYSSSGVSCIAFQASRYLHRVQSTGDTHL